MSLPSLRRRLILTLSGAGLLLLVIISLLMVVAEDKMEELSLRHWLEAEVTRYSDDWLRLGMAAPAPAHASFPATGPRPAACRSGSSPTRARASTSTCWGRGQALPGAAPPVR